MGNVLKTAFMCLIWALLLKFQMDYQQDQNATRLLKYTLENAVHDGALMISPDSLSEGEIVFDQYLAEAAFVWSFQKNTNMNYGTRTFIPDLENPRIFFKSPVNIVHMEFIDKVTIPDVVFPCNYGSSNDSCGNPNYEIFETISGPSFVVVAETMSPRFFSSKLKPIRQSAVYEYRSFD